MHGVRGAAATQHLTFLQCQTPRADKETLLLRRKANDKLTIVKGGRDAAFDVEMPTDWTGGVV
jgi:hypothetical protein